MTEQTSQLLAILDLRAQSTAPTGEVFLGHNEQARFGRLFGGQVLAQALRAASYTVDPSRAAHSLHGYFLIGGDPREGIEFSVDRLRDGRSFSARRVTARQKALVIFSLDASFHVAESGLEHQDKMPDVPAPESLTDDVLFEVDDLERRSWNLRERPFEIRTVRLQQPREGFRRTEDRLQNPQWIRWRDRVPESTALRRCLLAYASDMGIVSTGALPHGTARERLSMASLDHALWIHRDPPLEQWLLFAKRTVVGVGGRVLNHAAFFTRDGTIIASVAQEGVMRVSDVRERGRQ